MKQTLRRIISTSAVSVLAFSAVAQVAPKPTTDRPVYNTDRVQDASKSNTNRLGSNTDRLQDGSQRNTDRLGSNNDRLQDGSENTDRQSDLDRNRTLHGWQAEQIKGIAKASDLIGMTVKNNQDETLGDVDDLALDVESGRIVAIIVSSGGFLGIGEELSAVPPTALSFATAERDTLQLDASKEKLSSAPHFKDNQWPDFSEPGFASSLYQAFQVEPYFTTNATTQMDNTARNMRDQSDRNMRDLSDRNVSDQSARNVSDRDVATATPFDQGKSKTDVDTTAQIRKEINASEKMSVKGKNVKIMTKDGRVTLSGPVDSAEEKRLIGEIAKRISRSDNVDNQLEVKLATTASRD